MKTTFSSRDCEGTEYHIGEQKKKPSLREAQPRPVTTLLSGTVRCSGGLVWGKKRRPECYIPVQARDSGPPSFIC